MALQDIIHIVHKDGILYAVNQQIDAEAMSTTNYISQHSAVFIRILESVEDKRINRCKKYSMAEILLCIFVGVSTGAKSYNDIVHNCNLKIIVLRKFFKYEHGIPSHDTINRIMKILDPGTLEDVFRKLMSYICGELANKHLAIDGKALKNARIDDSGRFLTMVSVYCCDDNLTICQEKVEKKSNEIKAVPKLIEYLKLNGAIISMDAMGLQRETIKLITERGGDYLVCLKGNQRKTYEDVKLLVENVEPDDTYTNLDKKCGKVITRTYKKYSSIDYLQESYRWKNISCVISVETEIFYKGKTTNEIRYFISSKNASAEYFAYHIRSHWKIENNLHRPLDVVFDEDKDTKRAGNSAQNFSLFRKMSLGYLSRYFPKKLAIHRRQSSLMGDNEILFDFISSIM